MNAAQPHGGGGEPLAGKVAVVTGGGSGIGLAVARRLATCGATVVVADIDTDAAALAATQITGAGGAALAVEADVSSEASVDAMVAAVTSELGRLDIAVNNAGVSGGTVAALDAIDTAVWRRVLSVDLDGVFFCMRAELRVMRPARRGSIVNVSSILGAVGSADVGNAAYVAAKHGVIGLTRQAALECAPDGVRVNAIGPGFVLTPMAAANFSDAERDEHAQVQPMRRFGTPEEVAALTVWLASDDASLMTGTFVPVDGGYLAR